MDDAHPCLHLIYMLSSLAFAAEGFETELHVPLGIRQLFQDAHINKPVLASVLWTERTSAYPEHAAFQFPHILLCLKQYGRIPFTSFCTDTLDQAYIPPLLL